MPTQRVTAKDISGGRIRVPHETKGFFPNERSTIRVHLLGNRLECRWDPKYGPDKERSGVLTIGRKFAKLVERDERLFVFEGPDGVEIRRDAKSHGRSGEVRPLRTSDENSPSSPDVLGDVTKWRVARQEAAAKFKPDKIRLLLIAEAPPSALDRYFYFADVQTQDSLFRYVVRATLGLEPVRSEKREELKKLRSAGVFLIDLCFEPISDRQVLGDCVQDLIRRAVELRPEHIILIKTRVFDAAFEHMQRAGLPVVNARIAFPGSGQQRRFESEMRTALDAIAWTPPEVSL